MSAQLELIASDADAVRVAISIGASRVELCSALALGGLTASGGTIADVVQAAAGEVEVHALIRSRAGGFRYDDDEIRVMTRDIELAVAAGVDGVVVGALGDDGLFDERAMRGFVAAAGGKSVAAHRAIDVAAERSRALEQLIDLGVVRVLTSGGAATALEGAAALEAMVAQAAGRIDIMAGSGISTATVADVVATGVQAVHFSAKRLVPDSTGISMGAASREGLGPYEKVDADEARRIAAIVTGGIQ